MFPPELQLFQSHFVYETFTAWAEVTDMMQSIGSFEILWGVLAKRLSFGKNRSEELKASRGKECVMIFKSLSISCSLNF